MGCHHQNPLAAHYIEVEPAEELVEVLSAAVELEHYIVVVLVAAVVAVVAVVADPNYLAVGCYPYHLEQEHRLEHDRQAFALHR